MKLITEKFSIYNNFVILIILLGVTPIFQLLDSISNKNNVAYINHLMFFQALISIILTYIYSKKSLKKPLMKFLIILVTYLFFYYLISYLYRDEFMYINSSDTNDFQIITLKQYYLTFLRTNMSRFVIYLLIGINITKMKELPIKKLIKFLVMPIYMLLIISLSIIMLKSNGGSIFNTITFPIDGMHLYIGDTFALYSLVAYSILSNKIVKFFIGINSLYWLYKIGSRTSLYFFIIIFIFILIKYLFISMNIKKIILACTIIAIVFTIIWCGYDKIQNIQLNNRMTVVVTNVSEDSSYNSRKIMLDEGINDIKQHWFTGNMFVEIKRDGMPGAYVHNVLSYWIEFGLVPFMSIILLIGYNLYNNFKFYFKTKNSIQIELVFCLSTFIFMSTIFSRSYVYPYIWLALAASCDLYYHEKEVLIKSQ